MKSPEQRELRRAFAKWLSRILLPRLTKRDVAIPEAMPEMEELEEVHTMLAETAERWTREWMRDGEKKGRHDGKAEMLLDQLQERFGLIPESVQKQVESANLDDINIWARKIFRADSLQAVFH
ncbi:MAG: hypothetical protein HQL91_10265 [Magnetococcales bacterium]|nr:hypothetical protein [Magnetococcales bacterium]